MRCGYRRVRIAVTHPGESCVLTSSIFRSIEGAIIGSASNRVPHQRASARERYSKASASALHLIVCVTRSGVASPARPPRWIATIDIRDERSPCNDEMYLKSKQQLSPGCDHPIRHHACNRTGMRQQRSNRSFADRQPAAGSTFVAWRLVTFLVALGRGGLAPPGLYSY